MIVPSLTFCSTVNVIVHCGAVPVFADVDPVSLTVDPLDIEKNISGRTKVILPVHYAGYPCDMDPILALAEGKGISIVEDAAHALGASYGKDKIGAIGDVTCFSFYPTKTITTGEGGAVATNDSAQADQIRLLGLHGMRRHPQFLGGTLSRRKIRYRVWFRHGRDQSRLLDYRKRKAYEKATRGESLDCPVGTMNLEIRNKNITGPGTTPCIKNKKGPMP